MRVPPKKLLDYFLPDLSQEKENQSKEIEKPDLKTGCEFVRNLVIAASLLATTTASSSVPIGGSEPRNNYKIDPVLQEKVLVPKTYQLGTGEYLDDYALFNELSKEFKPRDNPIVDQWLTAQKKQEEAYFAKHLNKRLEVSARLKEIKNIPFRKVIYENSITKQIFYLKEEQGLETITIYNSVTGEEQVFLDPSGNNPEQIAQVPEGLKETFTQIQEPTFSVDGSRILIGFGDTFGDFLVFNTRTGENIGDFKLNTFAAKLSPDGKKIYAKPRPDQSKYGHYGSVLRIDVKTGKNTILFDAKDQDPTINSSDRNFASTLRIGNFTFTRVSSKKEGRIYYYQLLEEDKDYPILKKVLK